MLYIKTYGAVMGSYFGDSGIAMSAHMCKGGRHRVDTTTFLSYIKGYALFTIAEG